MRRLSIGFLLVLAYATVCLVWGSTYLAIRVGVKDLPPFLFAAGRHLIAGALLAAFCFLAGQPFPRGWRAYRDQCLVGLLMLAGGNGLVVWAEQWVDSSMAALLVATVPIFAAWFGTLLFGGRVRGRSWLGLLIGLAGVALLLKPVVTQGGGWLGGAFATLLAASSWALGSVYAQHSRYEGAFLPAVSVQMLAGGLVLGAIGIASGQAQGLHITARGIAALSYLVFCGSLLGYSAYLFLLRHLPAAKASTYAYVNPIVAVILGALLLAEPITARMLLAAPLILGGVLLVQTAANAQEGRPECIRRAKPRQHSQRRFPAGGH